MSAWKYKRSIRNRFLIDIFIILFVGTCITSVVIWNNVSTMLTDSLTRKGIGLASNIAKRNENALIMSGGLQLTIVYNELSTDEEIIYTIIRNNEGRILTTQYESINYNWPGLKEVLQGLSKDSDLQDIVTAINKHIEIREVSVPITIGSDTFGKVTIGMSEFKINAQIVKAVFFVIALNFIVAVVLGFVLFITSKKTILNPIIELERAADRLAKGDLSTRVAIKASGEIGALVDSFNQMGRDLDKTTVSRNYVDDIIKSMIDMLIVVSPDGTIQLMNPAACALLGYDEAEIIGRPMSTVLAASANGHFSMSDVLSKGSIGKIEKTYLAKNGRKVPVLFSASVMRDALDNVEGIVCVAQDITERKQAEEQLKRASEELHQELLERRSAEKALRESEKRYRMLFESAGDAIVILEAEGGDVGKIVEINKTAAEMHGYTIEELMHKNIRIFDTPESTHTAIPLIRRILGGEWVKGFEITHRRKNGTVFPVETNARLLELGNHRYILGFDRDISERKSAEKKLEQYAAELKQSNEDVLSFAYIVSHDLRAPLVSIKGFIGELQFALKDIGSILDRCLPHLEEKERTLLTAAIQKNVPVALNFMGSSASRMDGLINAVLTLSRFGHRELKPEPVDVKEVVTTILSSLEHQIEQRKTVVTLGELPMITADKFAMEQIMGNLIDNALKYLDPGRDGSIAISAEQNGEEIVFHIRDNGCGIAPEDLHKVFEIFRRVGKQVVPGEGMGLAYVKALVRKQGGRIWCESEPGKGSIFNVAFPLG